MADSPDLLTGMRLLDDAKARGFVFHRIAPGPDGPLEGVREIGQWRDTIHLGGFSRDCYGWRERTSRLVLPRTARAQIRTQGSAHQVLTEVLSWPDPRNGRHG